jgi:hypothetical protein
MPRGRPVTRLLRRALWSLLATLVIVGSGVAAIVHSWPHSPRGVPPGLVPASWAEYRTSPGHQSHVGAGKAVCSDCHDFEDGGFRKPPAAVCWNCHAKQTTHAHGGMARGADATDCLTCHIFAPDRAAPTCIGCHAKPHGEIAAIAQHADVDCAKCHRAHEERPIAPPDCTGCHNERATKHAAHVGSKECLDCHRVHEPKAAAASTCASCHAQPAGQRPAGHESCLTCHQPHDVGAGSERTCAGCHSTKTTLGAPHVQAHAVCTNCHAPHAPKEASGACVRCHADVHVQHGSKGECVGCHEPHGNDPIPKALACTSCHARVALSDTAAHAGHVACEGCHKPHAFEGLAGKTICKDCHAREVTLVAVNRGHNDCASCHGASGAHAPAASPPCASCHAPEQATAPAGHKRCVACHDAHADKPAPSCTTCHKDKTSGPHKAVQSGCDTCHRPHGPSGVAAPPTCKSCHAPTTLPALHASAGHTNCATCHVSSHKPPRADRTTCMGNCHIDKRGHEPTATVCSGCHVFRR